MTNRNPSFVFLNSESELLNLIPGDMVKVWFNSEKAQFMVYGLNPFEKLTEGSYLRLIEVPESRKDPTQFNVIESYVKFLQFKDGIRFNHLYTQYKLITTDLNSEFEKAKGLVRLLNKFKS